MTRNRNLPELDAMNRRHFLATLPPLVGAGMIASPLGAQTPTQVMQSLKYEALGRLVRAQTGKVVLVDLWRHD